MSANITGAEFIQCSLMGAQLQYVEGFSNVSFYYSQTENCTVDDYFATERFLYFEKANCRVLNNNFRGKLEVKPSNQPSLEFAKEKSLRKENLRLLNKSFDKTVYSKVVSSPENPNKLAETLINLAKLSEAKALNLNYLELKNLPPNIFSLEKLERLYLSNTLLDNNQIILIVKCLSQLQELDISGNSLSVLPRDINQLSQLRSLDLSNNKLKILPDSIGQLSKLQTLDLSHNQLKVVFESIAQLSQLQGLSFGHNQLKFVPENVGQLSQLQTLDFSHNQLVSIPKSIGQLSQLRVFFKS